MLYSLELVNYTATTTAFLQNLSLQLTNIKNPFSMAFWGGGRGQSQNPSQLPAKLGSAAHSVPIVHISPFTQNDKFISFTPLQLIPKRQIKFLQIHYCKN
jgi:hypothetical protein